MTREALIRELDQLDPARLVVTPPGPRPNSSNDEPLPWDSVVQYRGFDITRYHSGPWNVTHQWARMNWDLGDPVGYEQTIRDCMRSVDEWIEDNEESSS